jgi:hypothetical protein
MTNEQTREMEREIREMETETDDVKLFLTHHTVAEFSAALRSELAKRAN